MDVFWFISQMENIKFSKNIYVAQSLQKYLRDIHDATQQSENIGRVFFIDGKY